MRKIGTHPAPGSRGSASARRLLLRSLLTARRVASQAELLDLLGGHGYRVTQTTVSRDLTFLGARRLQDEGGVIRYALPEQQVPPGSGRSELTHRLREFVIGLDRTGSLVVLRTPPGAAGPVASALDRAPNDGILGTVAGDDTVLVITRSAQCGARVVNDIRGLMEGSAP